MVMKFTEKGMLMQDGTLFVKTPVGSFWGDPTEEQFAEIERDGDCLARRTVAGDLKGGLVPAIEILFQYDGR
jgi:hypothetical protein